MYIHFVLHLYLDSHITFKCYELVIKMSIFPSNCYSQYGEGKQILGTTVNKQEIGKYICQKHISKECKEMKQLNIRQTTNLLKKKRNIPAFSGISFPL